MVKDIVLGLLALLVGVTLVGSTGAAWVGGLGVISDARFERCPHCHRHGLVGHGPLHPHGCPPGSGARRYTAADRTVASGGAGPVAVGRPSGDEATGGTGGKAGSATPAQGEDSSRRRPGRAPVPRAAGPANLPRR